MSSYSRSKPFTPGTTNAARMAGSCWRYSSPSSLTFAVVLLLFSCCLAIPVHGAPLPTAEHSHHRRSLTQGHHRQLCSHHASQSTFSCGFHESCVESVLPCGNNGFARSYALHRCGRLRKFIRSTKDCNHCLHHQAVVDWALESERCLQTELVSLAQHWANKTSYKQATKPDPPECLHFEREALQKLSICYNSLSSSLCQLMSTASLDSIISDLTKVLKAFTKNDYYLSAVRTHLVDMLHSCNHSSMDSIVQTIFPPQPQKILFCAAPSGNAQFDMIEKIAEKLKRSTQYFEYAGTGDVNSNGVYAGRSVCRDQAPPGNHLLKGYQLILWSPRPNNTDDKALAAELIADYNRAHRADVGPSTLIKFFIYKTDESLSKSCGNGKREAGELCDVFANTGMTNFGCDKQCMPIAGYECSLSQLKNSTCSQTHCGDGRRTSDEECDTGSSNTAGCSLSCRRQAGFTCTQNIYNSTSQCQPLPTTNTPTTASNTATTTTGSSTLTTTSPSQLAHSTKSPSPVAQHLSASSSASSHWRTHILLFGLLPVLSSLLVSQACLLTHR